MFDPKYVQNDFFFQYGGSIYIPRSPRAPAPAGFSSPAPGFPSINVAPRGPSATWVFSEDGFVLHVQIAIGIDGF